METLPRLSCATSRELPETSPRLKRNSLRLVFDLEVSVQFKCAPIEAR